MRQLIDHIVCIYFQMADHLSPQPTVYDLHTFLEPNIHQIAIIHGMSVASAAPKFHIPQTIYKAILAIEGEIVR